MKYVLSIDGGGIRGIIPATILKYVEEKTGYPSAELFDLIAGTSTGGILGSALVVPDKNRKPANSANDILKLYSEDGEKIFSNTFWKKVSSMNGLFNERYSNIELSRALDRIYGDISLDKALKPLLITSYDLESREPFFFRSYENNAKNCLFKDAARGTSAAPAFFEPYLLTEQSGRKVLIDGSIIANNPAMFAYVEARKIFKTERMKIFSLGTGQHENYLKPIPYEKVKHWGFVKWAVPGLTIMLDESSSSVDMQLESLLGKKFIRLQPVLTQTDDSIDDITPENISNMQSEAAYFIERNYDLLDKIAKDLVLNYKINKVKKFMGFN